MSCLHDTSRCPVAERCTRCGQRHDLTVVLLDTVVGVFCCTLCEACVATGRLPWPESVPTTAARVLDHLGHVGLSADQAAVLLEAERRGDDEPGVDQ